MRSDQQTINGLTAYILGTTQSETSAYKGVINEILYTAYFGIQVWKRAADGTETEITDGTPQAVVSGAPTTEGIKSNTWECPQTSLIDTDAIVVRVYRKLGSGSWLLLQIFITEQLGGTQLDGVTWTVYYYLRLYYSWGNYYYRIYFGTSTYNSRITNFQWSTAPAEAWHTAETWLLNLHTLKWFTTEMWRLNLHNYFWSRSEIWQTLVHAPTWLLGETWRINLHNYSWFLIETWKISLRGYTWFLVEIWQYITEIPIYFPTIHHVNIYPTLLFFLVAIFISIMFLIRKRRQKNV